MLYAFLKAYVRLGMFIFARKIKVNHPKLLRSDAPFMLAMNHPNSFLDAIFMDILFKVPIWSLARGDVFKGKRIINFLTAIRILPVYRTSEGNDNLGENYKTFDTCIEKFRLGESVLIFSEGLCINEWHLRPLKKGTARLAIKAWDENVPMTVLPVGINYNSFRLLGKNIFINIGTPIHKSLVEGYDTDGKKNVVFNQALKTELNQLVYEIDANDTAKKTQMLTVPVPAWKKILLAIPALIGLIIHAPYFIPVKNFVTKKAGKTDHFDSVLLGVSLITYPFYVLLLTIILVLVFCSWFWLSLLLIPFTAFSYIQLSKQLD